MSHSRLRHLDRHVTEKSLRGDLSASRAHYARLRYRGLGPHTVWCTGVEVAHDHSLSLTMYVCSRWPRSE